MELGRRRFRSRDPRDRALLVRTPVPQKLVPPPAMDSLQLKAELEALRDSRRSRSSRNRWRNKVVRTNRCFIQARSGFGGRPSSFPGGAASAARS
jgi:hypothetical protein